MRIAILSDIHGNETALDEVLLDIERKKYKVDEIWCLGDIIGYGPRSLACLKKVKSVCAHVLQGNHERFAVMKANEPRYNLQLAGFKGPGAVEGLHWALRQLYGDATPIQGSKERDAYTSELLARVRDADYASKLVCEASKQVSVSLPLFSRLKGGEALVKHMLLDKGTREVYGKFMNALEQVEEGNELIDYMANLPTEKIVDVDGVKIHIAHDNFLSPGDCKYTLNAERDGEHLKGNVSLQETFAEWDERVKSNSEYEGVRVRALGHSHRQEMREHSDRSGCWFVNPGSVGMDRVKGEPPMARYAIINTDAPRFPVYTHSVEFDVEAVGAEMEAAGLPNKFASAYGGLD